MQLRNKLFHCSSLHTLLSQSKTKGEVLSVGAKTAIRNMVKEDEYNFSFFSGNKYTEKGNSMENMAIKESGNKRFREYEKNTIRAETDYLTGEADIIDLDRRVIVDTKCSWDLTTHPFFKDEARDKAIKAGYDVQLHGYFVAFEEYYKKKGIDIHFESGEIDFWLLPAPEDMISNFNNIEEMNEKINQIPLEKRLLTVVFKRDDAIIERIKQIMPHAQRYYKLLQIELNGDDL